MKKILIFGISGFVGLYLARELLAHGYTVLGSDLRKEQTLPEAVAFYSCDLLRAEESEALLKHLQPDMIVNLAAISSVGLSWSIPRRTMEVNVIGTVNLLEAARRLARLPRLMFVGSSEEYENCDRPISEETPLNAGNPYGISKITQEWFVGLYRERYGMEIDYVRPFNHTGVGQKTSFVLPDFCFQAARIEQSGTPGIIRVGNLAIERDFTDVRDIVRAYRIILESSCGEVFNVGSGEAYSLRELLDYIVSLCKQPITIEIDPARLRPADTPRILCDCSKIREKLGWKPQYTVFDSLREMYNNARDGLNSGGK